MQGQWSPSHLISVHRPGPCRNQADPAGGQQTTQTQLNISLSGHCLVKWCLCWGIKDREYTLCSPWFGESSPL